MKSAPQVELMNLTQNYVLFTNGVSVPITDYFDDDGDECEADKATVCVAGSDAVGWFTIEISPASERVVLQ